ncbi:hypothetical protein UFOVP503_7 [uncultured Caudovirales phage]|uniref:Uncharacterized protein n=2 Tax=uncultured Caudovirales phage TaxID=2100421 RepID=A0A6J5MI37_9CAUD|nr:hypothetical protein UFOVP503_7 [uncultured Caudovirales phage]
MFTGFASENTPAIKVWNFFTTFANTSAPRSVSLSDDCAPIQIFKTGATSLSAINVYLPAAAPEGKQIVIVNTLFGFNAQNLNIRSSDSSGGGSSDLLYTLGAGGYLILTYSKDFISPGPGGGNLASGWISLNYGNQTSSNYSSICIGNSAQSSGIGAVAIGGTGTSSSSTYSSAIGGANATASGLYSAVYGGINGIANSQNSAVIGGGYGTARSIVGNFVIPASDAPISSTSGRQQLAFLLLGVATTDATVTTLRSNSSAASTVNQLVLPNNSAYYVRGSCVANVTAGGNTKAWSFEAVIKRGANAASTALVAAVVPMVTAADAGAAAWTIAVSADTTSGALAVAVTGAAATTIRWVCKLESTEVTF